MRKTTSARFDCSSIVFFRSVVWTYSWNRRSTDFHATSQYCIYILKGPISTAVNQVFGFKRLDFNSLVPMMRISLGIKQQWISHFNCSASGISPSMPRFWTHHVLFWYYPEKQKSTLKKWSCTGSKTVNLVWEQLDTVFER